MGLVVAEHSQSNSITRNLFRDRYESTRTAEVSATAAVTITVMMIAILRRFGLLVRLSCWRPAAREAVQQRPS